MQGWTNVLSSTTGPMEYGSYTDPGSGSWRPIGAQSDNGNFMLAVTNFAPSSSGRDGEQDSPLLLRSPEFELIGSGQITAHLLGGVPKSGSTPPTNVSDVTGATPSSSDGYMGIALRRTSDDQYLLVRDRPSNSSSGWEQVVFTESELNTIFGSDPAGTMYTLDLVDWAHDSSWSSLALDSVSIPVDDARSVVAGGGKFQVLSRYSADSGFSSLTDALDLLALPNGDAGIASQTTSMATVIDMHDTGNPGHFGIDNTFNGGGGDDIATSITGVIEITSPGDVTFGFFANDGGRLMIDGVLVAEDTVGDLASDSLGSINLSAGKHALEFIHFENGGSNTVELYVATTNGVYTAFDQANFELLQASIVPEPATAGLLLLASAGLITWRRFGAK